MSNNDQQQLQTMQDIGGLLFRRLTNDLDIHEQIALDNWLNQQDPSSRQFFEDCGDWDQLQSALQVMYAFDEKAALADLQKKIDFGAATMAQVVEIATPQRKFRWYWAAAAVVMVIAGSAVFYTLDHRKNNIAALPVTERYRNDVAPGGDKAVLELADGKKIVLDNASNGELAQQGAVSVVKSDNGQLVYKVGKSNENTGAVGSVSYNAISTPKGGQYQVILPDGSKVWLNATSSLRFPTAFVGNERTVELVGEAYFQVEKDKSKPFRVKVSPLPGTSPASQPMEVEVLGTEFDLMAYADEDSQAATLISGDVVVKSGDKKMPLKPDQQIVLNKHTSTLNLINNPNVEEIVAWKDGVFQFHDASIQSIMRQAARWYDIEVVYAGKVDQLFIGKVPRQVNLSTLLKILEATGWVHFRIDGKRVTVFP